MTKPTQAEFETTRDVLEFILSYIYEYEPHARSAINNLEAVISENGFNDTDYDEGEL